MKVLRAHIFCRNGIDTATKVERLRAYCRRRKVRLHLVGETIENSVKMTAFKRLIADYKRHRPFDLIIVTSVSDLAHDLRSAVEVITQINDIGIRLRFVEQKFDFIPAIGRFCTLLALAQKEWRRDRIRLALEVTAYLNHKYRIGKSLGRPIKVTNDKRKIVETMLREGSSVKDIAREAGISQTSVKRVRSKMKGDRS